MQIEKLIGRTRSLFDADLRNSIEELSKLVINSRFLVVGGAGTIGKAVCLEIYKRSPKSLHVVDISENNLVELVRDIRSTFEPKHCDFRTYAIDCASEEFELFFHREGPFDYVLNLSALKHVRSEKDPYTLMRMIRVNVLSSIALLKLCNDTAVKKYFCVSTDKAANPANSMGASKRLMELFVMGAGHSQNVSLARFANVAFSDGSLLYGFEHRFQKKQPISAPNDIERYFMSPNEAGELCLMSCLLGDNRDIFFPVEEKSLKLEKFSQIAERYIRMRGFEPYLCESEEDARSKANSLINNGLWPCYFFSSDTSGEKPYEEFHSDDARVDFTRFMNVGIVKNEAYNDIYLLEGFKQKIYKFLQSKSWNKKDLIQILSDVVVDFNHIEKNKNLDERM